MARITLGPARQFNYEGGRKDEQHSGQANLSKFVSLTPERKYGYLKLGDSA
jgi:hypothetical protein